MLTKKSKNRATLKTSRCLQKPENKPQSTCWLYADLIGILIILLQKGEPTTQWFCKTGRGTGNMQIWENVNTGTDVLFPRLHMTSHPHSSCTSVAVFFPPSSWWRFPFFLHKFLVSPKDVLPPGLVVEHCVGKMWIGGWLFFVNCSFAWWAWRGA